MFEPFTPDHIARAVADILGLEDELSFRELDRRFEARLRRLNIPDIADVMYSWKIATFQGQHPDVPTLTRAQSRRLIAVLMRMVNESEAGE